MKWIKTIKSENQPLILVLERFNENVHVELFVPITIFNKHQHPVTDISFDIAFYTIPFDVDSICYAAKRVVNHHFHLENEIEIKEFVMDFMENNNY